MNNQNQHKNNDKKNEKKYSWIYLFILTVWVLLGVSAYISAFECTHERYTGGDARKIGMMFLAVLLGPFYWLIQPLVRTNGYCNLK